MKKKLQKQKEKTRKIQHHLGIFSVCLRCGARDH